MPPSSHHNDKAALIDFNQRQSWLVCLASYKMANFTCGSAQIEVYGNNAYNRDIDATFVSGVTVNVSTTNDDGHVTYQTITIAYDRIQEVISCSGLIIKSPSPTPTRLFFFPFLF